MAEAAPLENTSANVSGMVSPPLNGGELGLGSDGMAGPIAGSDAVSPIVSLISMGGPVLQLLAILSVITVALIFAKILQFSAARLGQRSRSGALSRVREATDDALRKHQDNQHIVKAGHHAARRELRSLESGLGLLGMIAMLSPLIGLLGTVIGMIGAFQALESAGGAVDPGALSSGIWVALLTTAAGLIVAIPATFAHGWLEGRLNRFADLAEEVIDEVVADRPQNVASIGLAAD